MGGGQSRNLPAMLLPTRCLQDRAAAGEPVQPFPAALPAPGALSWQRWQPHLHTRMILGYFDERGLHLPTSHACARPCLPPVRCLLQAAQKVAGLSQPTKAAFVAVLTRTISGAGEAVRVAAVAGWQCTSGTRSKDQCILNASDASSYAGLACPCLPCSPPAHQAGHSCVLREPVRGCGGGAGDGERRCRRCSGGCLGPAAWGAVGRQHAALQPESPPHQHCRQLPAGCSPHARLTAPSPPSAACVCLPACLQVHLLDLSGRDPQLRLRAANLLGLLIRHASSISPALVNAGKPLTVDRSAPLHPHACSYQTWSGIAQLA